MLTHVLGIVYRAVEGHILRRAGLARATGETGAVTLIQRFGSALNLNVHFHMLFLDGAYLTRTTPPVFRRIAAPSSTALPRGSPGLLTKQADHRRPHKFVRS